MDCPLTYIPEHLHTGDKPDIARFFINEILFRRCRPEDRLAPLDVPLYDVSLNRQGNPDALISVSDDVLWNADPEQPQPGKRYDGWQVAHLRVMELTPEHQYEKTCAYTGSDGNGKPLTISCTIRLKHDMLPCNYAHTVFQFEYGGQVVTKANYKQTLGKKGTMYSELRTRCKEELHNMNIKEEIWIEWPAPGAPPNGVG